MQISKVLYTLSLLLFVYTFWNLFFVTDPDYDYAARWLEVGAHSTADAVDVGYLLEIVLI